MAEIPEEAPRVPQVGVEEVGRVGDDRGLATDPLVLKKDNMLVELLLHIKILLLIL